MAVLPSRRKRSRVFIRLLSLNESVQFFTKTRNAPVPSATRLPSASRTFASAEPPARSVPRPAPRPRRPLFLAHATRILPVEYLRHENVREHLLHLDFTRGPSTCAKQEQSSG